MKVYDLEGNEYDKESIDARECVKVLGWSLSKPEPEEAKEDKKDKAAK